MKFIKTGFFLAALYSVASAQAADSISMEKIKTGILPSGDLYSIYAADCFGQPDAHVASMDRRTRWCIQDDQQLNCFRRPSEAARAACLSNDLVATDKDLDAINAFQ